MPLPIAAAAGGGAGAAARFGLPALLRGGRALVARVFGGPNGATAVAAASRRTGIRGGGQKILSAMKNNKVVTALVLLEMGSEGADLLSQMAAEDAEIARMIERYGVVNDPVESDTYGDIAVQADEMACITMAANSLGGLDELHNLRRALTLTEDHFKLYDTLRTLRGVIR